LQSRTAPTNGECHKMPDGGFTPIVLELSAQQREARDKILAVTQARTSVAVMMGAPQ
jgi:hypothetical protein